LVDPDLVDALLGAYFLATAVLEPTLRAVAILRVKGVLVSPAAGFLYWGRYSDSVGK
jgi:hypothetical protein